MFAYLEHHGEILVSISVFLSRQKVYAKQVVQQLRKIGPLFQFVQKKKIMIKFRFLVFVQIKL